jgi:hypothetical protein
MDRQQIRIVWIVNDKYVNNFITVYQECRKSKEFELYVIAVPHIGINGGHTISSHEVYEYLLQNNVECIDSWDPVTQTYYDIAALSPDYVFTTTPYNVYLPECYHSDRIAAYSSLCSVSYGACVISIEDGNYKKYVHSSFYNDAALLFGSTSQSESSFGLQDQENYLPIGYLKLDEYLHYGRPFFNPAKWHHEHALKVVWKPRWTLFPEESSLLDFIGYLFSYLADNNRIDFVLLTHPLLDDSLKRKEYKEVFAENLAKLNTLPNFRVESGSDFLDCVLGADVLIADHSSTMAEFAVTGHPIIFTSFQVTLSELGKRIMDTSYTADSFGAVTRILNDLMQGNDIYKRQRLERRDSYFVNPPQGMSIAQYLLFNLSNDYNNLLSWKRRLTKVRQLYIDNERKISEAFALCEQYLQDRNDLERRLLELDDYRKKLEQEIGDCNKKHKEDMENYRVIFEAELALYQKRLRDIISS